MNFVLERHHSVDSTNALALARASAGCDAGLVVVAAEQTAGRGRRTNAWFSPPGGLWFTVVLRPARLEGLSLIAGLAVGRALVDVDWCLHWPNDLYCGARKLGGILVETRLVGERVDFALVGIGLNVNNANFPEGLAATSLAQEVGRPFDLDVVLETVLDSLGEIVGDWETRGLKPFLEEIAARCPMVGRAVRYRVGDRWFDAGVDAVGEDGGLVLASGEKLLSVDQIDLVG